MLKKILTHSAIYGMAPNIPKIVSIFTLPVITKYLTAVDFGIAGTIAAYTGAIAVFSTLGMNLVLTTNFFRCRYHYKWLWRQIYGFLQYWMILFAILQSILLYFIIPEEAADNKWLIIGLTNFNTVFFGATSMIGTLHYTLLQKPIPVAIRSMISGLLTVFANLLFVAYFKMGYMGWYVSSFIASSFMNASYWWVVNKKWGLSPIYKFKLRTIKKSLSISIPAIPHYYSTYLLNSSSRLVMDQFNIPINSIGMYNLASQFDGYVGVVVNAFNTAINPMAMQKIRDNEEHIAKKMIFTMLIIVMSFTFLFSLWSKEIVYFLIKNDALQQCYRLVVIMTMAYNARPMYVASSNMFFYYENTKELLKISFAAGVFALIGYIIIIPAWGIWGAVCVYYISLQYMGYIGFFMKGYRNKTKVNYPFIPIFILSNLSTIAVFFLVESNIHTKILTSIILIIVALISIKKTGLSK